ncbi:MAG: Hsp20/alpha crystallin family protein [bacterium]
MARDWFDMVRRRQEDLESIFDDFFFFKSPIAMRAEAAWRPAVDVYQTKEDIVVCIELAGVPKESVEISVQGDVLVVSGIRKERTAGTEKRSYHKMEIIFGPFERRIHLPSHCDPEKAKVDEHSGLIRVVLPKLGGPSAERTEIEIE